MRGVRRRTSVFVRQWLRFPWKTTAWTLRERFREDRLGITAGSLTFTTTISLVPLFTVGLAIFSVFPEFDRLDALVHQWLMQNWVPGHIAEQVSGYLLQFADKAGQVGWVGALVLLATALVMILTIDHKLNDIWRVRRMRPLAQRVLVYWALLTLGPLLVGLSLSLSSYALSVSRGWVGDVHLGLRYALDALEFVVVIVFMAALYRYVPNAQVRWSHALLGGLFVWVALEVAQRLLTWYLTVVPTHSVIYGAFATVPILLIWLYLAWAIVLLGAVVVAYMPALLSGVARRGDRPGGALQMALEVLVVLRDDRWRSGAGVPVDALMRRLRVDPLQLEQSLQALEALSWIGRLAGERTAWVLLADPEHTLLSPLLERLLLVREDSTAALWRCSRWDSLRVADVLG